LLEESGSWRHITLLFDAPGDCGSEEKSPALSLSGGIRIENVTVWGFSRMPCLDIRFPVSKVAPQKNKTIHRGVRQTNMPPGDRSRASRKKPGFSEKAGLLSQLTTGEPWIRPSLQQKLHGFVSPFRRFPFGHG
jgi:hypothetical protein